jgi:hypothetical protein
LRRRIIVVRSHGNSQREGESTGSLLDLPIFEIEQSLLETLTAMTSSLLYIATTQRYHLLKIIKGVFVNQNLPTMTKPL